MSSSYLGGIFGLRRSGKTSMLNAIERQLKKDGCIVVFIPCQLKLKPLDWKNALYRITEEIRDALGLAEELLAADTVYERDCENAFSTDMDTMLRSRSSPVVLMFDEIEAITFGIGDTSSPWYDGNGFVRFWDALRGYCIRPSSNLSIVIAGTNAMINETPFIGKSPNPMLLQLSVSNQGGYLRPFDIASTKTMIDTLGGYMGIRFNDSIPGRLVEDCGGHPYLIRLLCGYIYKYIREKEKRPFTVSKAVYEAARSEFEKSSDVEGFYLMILEILQSYYPPEYETLKILAIDGDGQLSRILDDAQIKHLLGYGLIEKNGNRFSICYDTIKRFLEGKYQFERTGLNNKQKALEISTRMNECELHLRALVRRTLNAHKKELNPKKAIIDAMSSHTSVTPKQLQTAQNLEYRELFDTNLNRGMYFLVLVFAIEQNYDTVFSVFFDEEKSVVINRLKTHFSKYRTIRAHPNEADVENLSDEEFYHQFRPDMLWLEKILIENE